MKALNTIVLAGLFAGLFACKSEPKEYQYEECTSSDTVESLPRSVLNLPLDIPLDEIEEIIHSEIPFQLLYDQNVDHDQITIDEIRLTRNGRTKLSGSGNTLKWNAPLKCKLVVTGNSPLVKMVLNKKEISFAVDFFMESDFDIDNTYNLHTDSRIADHKWREEPYLKFNNFQLKLTGFLDGFLEDFKKDITRKLDSVIAAKVNLKKPVAKVWGKLHRPVRLNKDFKEIWMNTRASKIELQQVVIQNDFLHLNLGIAANLTAVMTDSVETVEVPALPDLTKNGLTDEDFTLYLDVRMPFAEINSALAEEVTGKNVEVKDKKLTVEKAEAFCAGEQLAFEMKVSGDMEARFVVTGKPVFDKDDRKLKLKETNFEMLESDFMASAAHSVYKKELLEMIENRATLELADEMERLPLLIEEQINKKGAGKKHRLNIKEMEVIPVYLNPHKEEIVIQLKASGKAEMKLIEINKKAA